MIKGAIDVFQIRDDLHPEDMAKLADSTSRSGSKKPGESSTSRLFRESTGQLAEQPALKPSDAINETEKRETEEPA